MLHLTRLLARLSSSLYHHTEYEPSQLVPLLRLSPSHPPIDRGRGGLRAKLWRNLSSNFHCSRCRSMMNNCWISVLIWTKVIETVPPSTRLRFNLPFQLGSSFRPDLKYWVIWLVDPRSVQNSYLRWNMTCNQTSPCSLLTSPVHPSFFFRFKSIYRCTIWYIIKLKWLQLSTGNITVSMTCTLFRISFVGVNLIIVYRLVVTRTTKTDTTLAHCN